MNGRNSFAQNRKVTVACDHAGIDIKLRIIAYLNSNQYSVYDFGVHTSERVDYPDIAYQAIDYFYAHKQDFLILICGTGIGMSITANKRKGIYCALIDNTFSAEMARKHNHANCLAIPARVKTKQSIEEILDSFFNSIPEIGRHQERINKIKNWESKCL